MATKKNLPYIPLYTGDWEKDCNILSLEAEAAWLRIIFKMFNGGKQSSYKIPTKALQNLWRVNEEKMLCIISELSDNDICGIAQDERFITFTSRRYERENRISEIRREAVSNREDRQIDSTKDLQTAYKTDTNILQNAEIEIENDNSNKEDIIDILLSDDSNIEGGMGGDSHEESIPQDMRDFNTEEFERWWKLYDKKVGDKKKLLVKWGKIPKREKDAVFGHTKLYVEATPDKKFRKDPQTYLNNKSWNDEIIDNGKNNRTINDETELGRRIAAKAIQCEYEKLDSGKQTEDDFRRRTGIEPLPRHLRNP